MTHIAIVEQLDGKIADWMEKVSDEQYQAWFRALCQNFDLRYLRVKIARGPNAPNSRLDCALLCPW